jgi:hypothetical protein
MNIAVIPVKIRIRISLNVLSYTPNNLNAHHRLKQQLSKMMKNTPCQSHGNGCHQGLFDRNLFLGQQIPLAGVSHQNGTVTLWSRRTHKCA